MYNQLLDITNDLKHSDQHDKMYKSVNIHVSEKDFFQR